MRSTLTWSAVVGALMLGLVLWPQVSHAPAVHPAVSPMEADQGSTTAADTHAVDGVDGESEAVVAALAHLHRPKRSPKPGDWLASFDEPAIR